MPVAQTSSKPARQTVKAKWLKVSDKNEKEENMNDI
jgi:hypothetical protein